jgi:HEAT repeat protein
VQQVRTGDIGAFEAAQAIGRLALESPDLTVPALVEALGSENEDVARSAARSLGRAGRAVLPRLAEAFKSERAIVRRRATEALVWMGPDGVTGLIAALRDQAPEIRQAGARGLGRIGPAAAAAQPVLLRAVNDPDAKVRTTAAKALRQITGEGE